MLYFRFILCLGIGLVGVAIVLKTLFDVLFEDWDVIADIRAMWADLSRRSKRIILVEPALEGKVAKLSTRLVEDRTTIETRRAYREKQFLAPPDTSTLRIPVIHAPNPATESK